MAEHIQKRARYENSTQHDQLPSPQSDIAADNRLSFLAEVAAADEQLSLLAEVAAVQSLYYQSQEEDEMTTTSINSFHTLSSRKICRTGKRPKLPNIFRDYFVELHDAALPGCDADFVIAGGDIVVINCDMMYIYPYRRDGGFSPFTDEDGAKIVITKRNELVCYNKHNNSLIIAEVNEESECTCIVSLGIESVKAGLTTEQITICPTDSNMIGDWDFDIPNCRGMIYNNRERLFKVFELKNYRILFTLPHEGDDSFHSCLRFGSSGNMELIVMMYSKMSARMEEFLLRIYSKLTGQLRKRISIPVYPNHKISYVKLCGTDRILVQQLNLGMQIFDISGQICKVIKTSDIQMPDCPRYLCKRNLFICPTEIRGTRGVSAFNLEGEIVHTFQDHRLCETDLSIGSHITTEEDILISVCSDKAENMQDATEPGLFTINISSILTGKCIEKITAATSNCSKLQKLALRYMCPMSLAYNEATHEIFTASRNGDIYIWSNKLYSDINNLSYGRNVSGTDEEDSSTDEDESTDGEESSTDEHNNDNTDEDESSNADNNDGTDVEESADDHGGG